MRIKEKLQHIIKNSLKEINITRKLNEITIESSKDNNSDYYTNIAISLSKDLHKKPEEIAELLKNKISDELIEKIEVTYPGTINIYLNKKTILNGIKEIIEKNINYGKSNIGENRKINIDFIKNDFTQNITKENIFNAIYVDNISRILKFNGFEVIKELYIDDASEDIDTIANITKQRYINICNLKNSFGENNEYKSDIRDTAHIIYSLYRDSKQNEDTEYFKKQEISTSLDKIKKDLDKMRINFDIYTNEQNLYDKGLIDTVLNKLNKKGYTYFYQDELWLKTTDYGDEKDRKLIKNDGSYTYLLPQTAYYIDKLNRKYDGIISIYNKEWKNYKTSLKPILNMLEQDVNKIEIKLLPEINVIEKQENEINLNNIRYLFASQKINEPINIDLDEKNNDNKINYIENTNIKIHNLLSNYNKKITKVNKFSTIDNCQAYIIVNKLLEFEDVVIKSCLKQMPHLICNYLYELSKIFDNYQKNEKIITEDEVYTNERLNLLLAIRIVMNNAFNLIGIIPREEM